MEWEPVFSAFQAQNIFARTTFSDCIFMQVVSDFPGVILNGLHKCCIFGDIRGYSGIFGVFRTFVAYLHDEGTMTHG